MNTQELNEAVSKLNFGNNIEDRIAYRQNVRDLQYKWQQWLHSEYACQFSQTVADKIFAKAWEDCHSNGYSNVEVYYDELVDFVYDIKDDL